MPARNTRRTRCAGQSTVPRTTRTRSPPSGPAHRAPGSSPAESGSAPALPSLYDVALYDAALAEHRDVGRGPPELAEDLVGLLPEQRGVVPDPERLPRHRGRPADRGEGAGVRVHRLVDDLARPDVRVIEDVLGLVGRAHRDVMGEREIHPLVHRARVE